MRLRKKRKIEVKPVRNFFWTERMEQRVLELRNTPRGYTYANMYPDLLIHLSKFLSYKDLFNLISTNIENYFNFMNASKTNLNSKLSYKLPYGERITIARPFNEIQAIVKYNNQLKLAEEKLNEISDAVKNKDNFSKIRWWIAVVALYYLAYLCIESWLIDKAVHEKPTHYHTKQDCEHEGYSDQSSCTVNDGPYVITAIVIGICCGVGGVFFMLLPLCGTYHYENTVSPTKWKQFINDIKQCAKNGSFILDKELPEVDEAHCMKKNIETFQQQANVFDQKTTVRGFKQRCDDLRTKQHQIIPSIFRFEAAIDRRAQSKSTNDECVIDIPYIK